MGHTTVGRWLDGDVPPMRHTRNRAERFVAGVAYSEAVTPREERAQTIALEMMARLEREATEVATDAFPERAAKESDRDSDEEQIGSG